MHFWEGFDILLVSLWLGEVVNVNRVKRENERTGVCDYGQAGFFKDIGWVDGGGAYAKRVQSERANENE